MKFLDVKGNEHNTLLSAILKSAFIRISNIRIFNKKYNNSDVIIEDDIDDDY